MVPVGVNHCPALHCSLCLRPRSLGGGAENETGCLQTCASRCPGRALRRWQASLGLHLLSCHWNYAFPVPAEALLSHWTSGSLTGSVALGLFSKGNLKVRLISFQGVKYNAILVFLGSHSLRKMLVSRLEGRRRSYLGSWSNQLNSGSQTEREREFYFRKQHT